MSDPIEAQVRQIAADVFNLSVDEVTNATSPDSIENWDSIQHLNLVLALEQKVGVYFTPEDIDQMLSVGSVIEVVRRKLGR